MRTLDEKAKKILRDATFAIETVAHLRGLERELLPAVEAVRRVITGNDDPPIEGLTNEGELI